MTEAAREEYFAFEVGNSAAVVEEVWPEYLAGDGLVLELQVVGEPYMAEATTTDAADELESISQAISRRRDISACWTQNGTALRAA